jgi:hypothetical protein
MNTYDLPARRKALITLLARTLSKDSKFYREDYESICRNVNRMKAKQLRESLARQTAAANVTEAEISAHCVF